jgi:hypothetical protein
MLYIHQTTSISPQQTFGKASINQMQESVQNKLHAIEPDYPGIPPGLLRRMGKAVRIGVGAALPMLKTVSSPDGIIIGTANGGMEDCIKFLNQIIEYNEGLLAPGNFVQSTANAIASTIGLMTSNKKYNITHVHRGLAFENALIDALMLSKENPSGNYLLGAVDEISAYNYNIDYLDGWYKKEAVSNLNLYQTNSAGSIAGEGAVMFLVNGISAGARASIHAITSIHSDDENIVEDRLRDFIEANLNADEKIDLLITGENGDNRLLRYYIACENIFADGTTIARFKHMSGEFPTASAIGVWLACYIFQTQSLPDHMIKRNPPKKHFSRMLLYNNFKGRQHSFMMLSRPNNPV